MSRFANSQVLMGLVFAAAGLAIALVAATYPQGTLRVMGPGFMPRQLGLLLVLLGAGITLAGVVFGGARPQHPTLAPVLSIAVGVLLFGALAAPAGLVAAAFAACLPVALVGFAFRPLGAIAASALLAAGGALLFGVLLRLPLPLWPA